MQDPSHFEKFASIVAVVVTWFGGEAGRVVIAGAAGGFYRWLWDERRNIRDGFLQIIAGACASFYLGPIVMGLMEWSGVTLGDPARAYLTAGFLAGMGGISLAKLILAALESQVLRFTQGGKDK